jgi:hypothetical protein
LDIVEVINAAAEIAPR